MFIHVFAYWKFQIRQALKEQQDVNEGLRGYIDGILMNIMEKYPELLEVRKWPELSGYNHWTYIEKDTIQTAWLSSILWKQ